MLNVKRTKEELKKVEDACSLCASFIMDEYDCDDRRVGEIVDTLMAIRKFAAIHRQCED